jgi:hypothetical protein
MAQQNYVPDIARCCHFLTSNDGTKVSSALKNSL